MTRSGEGKQHSMAGVLEAFSLRVFLAILLTFSFLFFWIPAPDAWWRPKEYVVLALGLLWIGWKAAFPRPVRRSHVSIPMALLLGWIAVGFIVRFLWPAVAFRGAGQFILWPILVILHIAIALHWFLDGIRSADEKDAKVVSCVLAALGGILSIHMLLQALSLDPMIAFMSSGGRTVRWLHDNHMVGVMGNSFQAAACVAVLAPFILSFSPVLFILSLIVLIAAKSTGALLAAGASAVVYLFLTGKRLLASFLAAAALIGAFFWVGIPSILYDFSGRLLIWEQSVRFVKAHPLIGTGIGTYKLLGISVPTLDKSAPNAVRWAHNEFLQTSVEIGLVGAILLILWVCREFLRSNAQTAAFSASLVSIAVLSLVNMPLHIAPIACLALINLIFIRALGRA